MLFYHDKMAPTPLQATTHVRAQFTELPPTTNSHIKRQKCRHCSKITVYNVTRQRNHLQTCIQYKSSPEFQALTAPTPTQQASTDIAQIDLELARVILYGGLPFTHFDKQYYPQTYKWVTAIYPNYQVPHRTRFAGDLLDTVYEECEQKILAILASEPLLNFSFDESYDNAHHRIINLSVNIPDIGAFSLAMEDLKAIRFSAENLSHWVLQELQKWTQNELEKVNCIATDTCKVMRNTHKLLATTPQLKQVFFVNCCAHGFQLLMGDILKEKELALILKNIQHVLRRFKRSKLQFAYVRQHQIDRYSRQYGLTLAVITRWGTHYSSALSLLRSKEALFSYAMDTRAQTAAKTEKGDDNGGEKVKSSLAVMQLLRDDSFWAKISKLERILQPIHEVQKKSEGENQHLGKVYSWWHKIITKWDEISAGMPEEKPLIESLKAILTKRLSKQVGDLEMLAWALDPVNSKKPLSPGLVPRLQHQLKKYLDKQAARAIDQFWSYRDHKGDWNGHGAYNPWTPEEVSNPKSFWRSMEWSCPELSKLAVRLFSSISSSCSSERAFSAMNFVQDARRASLAPERQARCTFVYVNNRVLERVAAGRPRYSWWTLTEEQLQELDELVYEAWEGGVVGGTNEEDEVAVDEEVTVDKEVVEDESEIQQDERRGTQTLFENCLEDTAAV
jgi:hypothetical protein